MSCSKIFSGDSPELTYEVIKNFQNDFSTLHSCILVNRLWCRLTIPLLWENPFSISTGNYSFIGIYLHNLNDDLKGYEIVELIPLNTLFNYSNFIKYLNIREFFSSVDKWVAIFKNSNPSKYNTVFIKLVHKLLFKIFIENEINLYTLEIEIFTYSNEYLNNIFELILQNTNFIHNIKNLKLFIYISHFSENNENMLVKNHLSKIINLHQNLKKILLSYDNIPLYQSLLLSKDYNCSNTLNTLVLYKINFNGIFNLNKIFEQLNVLESVHIIYCFPINIGVIQQIINLSKPFKLKSLLMDWTSQIDESFQSLLQKSGDYLEKFNFEFEYNRELIFKQQIFESIIKYCKNIKSLDLHENNNQIFYQIFKLIENIKHKLNYLSIRVTSYVNNNKCSSIILQNLGQILPSNLEYLHLNLYKIKASDFEIFLKNSQGTFIKKLLIRNSESQDILPPIKEYIMKKKRVKYLAIVNSSLEMISEYNSRYNEKELFSLHDEVKEFSLYNIKVQSYLSLVIRLSDFIKKIN
ncbi:uncharacterized protein OCT59_019152 [Rhizophagus irregularis]|uniref:F-box domain-containing protein n=1 Tax=Rhizophagus irregularis (strain DAOM 181602 / DAOM 197198 / MUCL 43194) TaxID=747089 RepID=A0A2H5SUD7_RHIID|nr:hypothetical protein GLOIN_2v1767512 [Rhizophagus irregularis DAOM 181602=DAOM 197198]POG77679.1 hypothetical protein GLOIN_2v1767512 [Rhizophagus irregularis DAOM 181602=DAOM 197198]UZO26942.1 hypothetical protein OCT59_019152 [Rhizophagus irregularis]GBC33943.1 hypothetical protein GLOIN_2v1767512 [Rhizophagus irregularis DAOM 181602=DAOM 197198]|eukprot:XP_025184545.1 hypothetical protein GLOIN_2v1767512 [Rhizophagus irregularis DAOM 181602=DAOM 197198]